MKVKKHSEGLHVGGGEGGKGREIDRLREIYGGTETNERCNRLELDQHYQAGQIQAVIPGRDGWEGVCVCAVNLFIYLSLAAIMVFILSLSVSVCLVMGDWVSCVA